MKISTIALLFATSASAFVPTSQRASFVRPLCMSDDEPTPAAKEAAIVPVKQETVEFTAGLIGGAAGFAIGGPVFGAIGAAAANYVSKQGDGEVTEVISAISKSSIEVFNFLSRLDAKYELLDKSKDQLEAALDKAKSSGKTNPETIEKIESALSSTKAKITELNDEYDLVGAGSTALGVVGDLVEKAIKKAGELNEEYQLTDKAKESLSVAVAKAKEASNKA